jgi:hypothetical protein
MRVMRFSPLLAIIAAALLCNPALGATVTAQQGQVLVNSGNGYQHVTGAVEAEAGATVVANPGGRGHVVYPDGCWVAVEPATVYAIAPRSPCETGTDQPGTGFGMNGTTLAVGALVVGGGVTAAVLLSKGKPASP